MAQVISSHPHGRFGREDVSRNPAGNVKRMGAGTTAGSARGRVAGIACVVLFASACAQVQFEPVGPLFGGPGVPAFTRQPNSQPAISSGRGGLPIIPVDPNVYVDAEGYHLFYSTFFCWQGGRYVYTWDPANPYACNIENIITAIAYAFSADRGLTWTFRQSPVVQPSNAGFDSGKIETAAVFRIGDVLYLAYSADGDLNGRPFTARYQIGLARLVLGRQSVRAAVTDESRQFERRPTPWLPFDLRPGRFDHNVQEPSVTIGPDGIVLYFLGLGLRLPNEPLDDAPGQGIASVGLGRAVLDEQLNVISRSDAAVLGGVNMPEVRYFDGAYHLFGTTLGGGAAHEGGAGHENEEISYATSPDGVQWSRPGVILSPGGVPGFNDWGLMAPTAAVESDRVVLFYTAYGTESRACFPVPPQGRFGLPVANGARCMFPTVARAVAPRPLRPGAR